jgi:site-specific recombinase XerD
VSRQQIHRGTAAWAASSKAGGATTPARSAGAGGRSAQSRRRRSYEDFWRFQLGQGLDDPAKGTRDDVNRWTDNVTSRSRRDGRRGALTPQTVAILWRSTRPFFAWWATEEDAPNPFANADRPPEGDHSPDVIHLDDIRALVATCKGREFDDLRDEAIIRLLFDTGTRLGELAGIQLDDWDTRQDFPLVDGKSGPRLVPMSASTAEACTIGLP